MRISLKVLVPLVVVFLFLAYGSVLVFDAITVQWFHHEVETRTGAAGRGLAARLPTLDDGNVTRRALEQVAKEERMYAIGLCGVDGTELSVTQHFRKVAQCSNAGLSPEGVAAEHYQLTTVEVEGLSTPATLLLVNDMQFAARRSAFTARYLSASIFILGLLLAGVTFVGVRLAWRRWVANVQQMIREKGDLSSVPSNATGDLAPLARELRSIISELETNKKLNDGARIVWDSKTLKEVLSARMSDDEIVVVSNREPYLHQRRESGIVVELPASGLVTALEPVMRACSGIWVAHGSGSADRDVVDENDRVWVPPGENSYQIRRLWLSKEEEQGYYYGFSNEGIWPLCHIAHTRPIFRSKDWEMYRAVNERFAEAVLRETHSDSPVVLVQDYHFALLPDLIREKLPQATIITFWHIPWPNPEAFSICPWRAEILRGLLGSTILGFHTDYHRNNFLETVDRTLETRIDREQFNVSYRERITAVRSYPISIEWPPKYLDVSESIESCDQYVRKLYKLKPETRIVLGVDRLDYTKGILERFLAIERLLELRPELIGSFVLLQIASPSRSQIDTYSRFSEAVEAETARINARFASNGEPPIRLIKEHREPKEVYRHYRVADVCMVTSLHDGMNLVAKEYIASRTDEEGVLILSLFTGASRELPEAIIVNPYSIDQCAEALRTALEMPLEEQRNRMRSLREQVREFNIYRWAGQMLIDAAQVREKARLSSQLTEPPAAQHVAA